MSVLDKVRSWIDGDTAELVLEQAARDAQVKPRSVAEAFIVKIARAIEDVMQREMVPLPQGTTIIPNEYIIFLSDEDDKEWQGVKRKGLEQGLYHILAERAKEIAGKKKLETKSFVIELRVDGTLPKDEIRIQHSWEDSEGNKTGVLSRPKSMPPENANQAPRAAASESPMNQAAGPNGPLTAQYQPPQSPPNFIPNPGSTPVSDGRIQQAVPLTQEDSEVMTNVRRRAPELYKLEVWRGGVRQNVVPIYNNEITVGRGSRSKPVDIALSGDPEISRRHLSVTTDGAGNFWVVNEGRNAAMINNRELGDGQPIALLPGENVAVCSYILRIQPR